MLPEDEKTITIARRTKKNLNFIYKSKEEGADVEEFTQLLNSMFGMIICIREDFFKGGSYSWDELEKLNLQGWDIDSEGIEQLKAITGIVRSDEKPRLKTIRSFSQLLTKLRNAFAHNCYEFLTEKGDREIYGIKVWNIKSEKKNIPPNRTWEADINKDELRLFAELVLIFLEVKIGMHYQPE